jgi:hypothetical protein
VTGERIDRSLGATIGPGVAPGATDLDEALSLRLRDLSLVDLDALIAGAGERGPELVTAFVDDVGDALREARSRIAALRTALGGADPLNVLDATARQRASDAGAAGVERVRSRLHNQADAARALARLADLAAALAPKLFEAERRR